VLGNHSNSFVSPVTHSHTPSNLPFAPPVDTSPVSKASSSSQMLKEASPNGEPDKQTRRSKLKAIVKGMLKEQRQTEKAASSKETETLLSKLVRAELKHNLELAKLPKVRVSLGSVDQE